MTTKTKVADRYAALAAIAQTLDGVAFTPSKKPTTKDCEELSAIIDAHRSTLAIVVLDDDVTSDAVDEVASMTNEDVLDYVAPTSVDERAAAIEAKRADARRRFETATKATTAHGYALISAATNDGDRMSNMRAKLAEMPEGIRAQACKLAADKLVQPGSSIHEALRALYSEQPKQERAKAGGVKRSLADETAVRKNGYAHIFVGEGVDATFSVVRTIVNGKIVFTITQH